MLILKAMVKPQRDPEDIFDEIALTWFRWILKYAWPVAEPVFKMVSWLIICTIIIALGNDTDRIEIKVFGGVLSGLWFVAVLSIMFKAIGIVQDAARDHWLADIEEHSGRYLLINLGITALTVLPLIQIFVAVLGIAAEISAILIQR